MPESPRCWYMIVAASTPDDSPALTATRLLGHMPVAEGLNSVGFQALAEGVRNHGWWVKLSGAYRISQHFDGAFDDVKPWAQALVEAAPEHMLWGSDWPHVAIPRMPNTGDLRNLLATWVPDAAVRNRILVDNPAKLYGFPEIE
ncbi:MAG: amidohydrolase family protein [Mycobacterium sp.]